LLAPLLVDGTPHWESKFPAEVWPAFEEFRNFLALVWDHLGLPEPTQAQFEIAHRLQYSADSVELDSIVRDYATEHQVSYEEAWSSVVAYLTDIPREDIVRAFRGIGKSYITAAFAIWRLMRNPRDEKILVISATGAKAKEFVDQVKGVLESMPLVQWLLDGPRERGSRRRDMADKFDVAGASNSQSYSVKAVGIDGQITGSRSTLIIADDIEIPKNSMTEEARQRILNKIRSDFGPIAKTEFGKGDIVFLGTPQTEESVYNVLVKEMGYSCFTIPARFPAAEKLDNYVLERKDTKERVNILAPYLRALHDAGQLNHLAPTDTRFSNDELLKSESKGRSQFALQYMLDTSLSDAERYPLKLHDLVIFATNPLKAPLTVQWGRHSDGLNVIRDIPNVGFSGDHYLRPLFIDSEWRPYEGRVLFVDPAGRGKDETAWAVLGQIGGTLYALEVNGHAGDPNEAMWKIALDAKKWNVNVVEVEPNYGQGMWMAAFKPILLQVWGNVQHTFLDPKAQKAHAQAKPEDRRTGTTVQESEWAKGQKEVRIIDTLEPVLTSHRLVLSEELARREALAEDPAYSLLYQLTHITRERGALAHDDRLEALAGAVNHFQRAVEIDADEARRGQLEAETEMELERFVSLFEDGGSVASLGFRQGITRRRGKHLTDEGEYEEVWQVRV
jgi:hypothetical protein